MSTDTRVQNLLSVGGLEYERVRHFDAFGAFEAAVASHVPEWEMAKAVVVRAGDARYLMAVVPSTCPLDLDALASGSGHADLALATEEEVALLFPDCEIGAVPPFGQLYDMPTFLDMCLCEAPEIFFTAGSRRELVGMRVADFVLATGPMVGQFCRHAGACRWGTV
jgi:Ala-tRNA(Pro) deacylase